MRSLAACFVAVAIAGSLAAQTVVLTLDPGASQLSISGTTLGATSTPQYFGGETTGYSGTITVTLSGSSFTVDSANLVAQVNGVARPASGSPLLTSPANYGSQFDFGFFGFGYVAVRNLTAGLSSGPLALTGTDFTPAGTVTFQTGVIQSFVVAAEEENLAGDTVSNASPDTGSLSVTGLDVALVLPISISLTRTVVAPLFGEVPVTFTVEGSLTALGLVPEPAAAGMLAGGLGLAAVALRRRR